MATEAIVNKFETLQLAIFHLLDLKRMYEKVVHESKVLQSKTTPK